MTGSFNVKIKVHAHHPTGPYRPLWNWRGDDEPNYTYTENGSKPEPRLIVADELVSMIDASLRMSIVNLFTALRHELGASILYITHDLATTYYISDRVIIMRKGAVVESGDTRKVLDAPGIPIRSR